METLALLLVTLVSPVPSSPRAKPEPGKPPELVPLPRALLYRLFLTPMLVIVTLQLQLRPRAYLFVARATPELFQPRATLPFGAPLDLVVKPLVPRLLPLTTLDLETVSLRPVALCVFPSAIQVTLVT